MTDKDNNRPFPNVSLYFKAIEEYMFLKLHRLESLNLDDKQFFHELHRDSLPPDENFLKRFHDSQLSFSLQSNATALAGHFPTLNSLISRLQLTKFQVHCIMLALVCATNLEYCKVLEKYKLSVSGAPTLRAAILLYRCHDSLRIDRDLWVEYESISDIFFQEEGNISLDTAFSLNGFALSFFTNTPPSLPYYLSFYLKGSRKKKHCISSTQNSHTPQSPTAQFSSWEQIPNHSLLLICGKPGSGRKALLKDYCDSIDKNIIFADYTLLSLMKETDLINSFRQIRIACMIYHAHICFTGLDASKREISLKHFRQFSKNGIRLFATSQSQWLPSFEKEFPIYTFSTPATDMEECKTLWREALAHFPDNTVSPEEFCSKFNLTKGQIHSVIQELSILNQNSLTSSDLTKYCYYQTLTSLSHNAEKINAVFTWEDLVLDKKLIDRIRQCCNHIKLKHIVYDKWNFSNRFPYGTGLNILFSGPPGTGKTMVAQVIANELGMDLFRIDLSAVVSKYVGETEKNLNSIFENAKNSNVILFFDEMDALFGKRSKTKDAKDKYANMEIAFLLQKIEEYNGVILMATNFMTNIDEAFMRRLHYIFHIPFPDENARLVLWKQCFPNNAPLHKDVDFSYLAKSFELSGAIIKNIAVSAAFLSAAQNQSISMKHILRSTKLELSKQGKILLNQQDFGSYAFLLEGDSLYETTD